jgi:hypothetical protein
VTVLDMEWEHISGAILDKAFKLHTECKYDFIIYFEADEVFDHAILANALKTHKMTGFWNFGCHRIQLEQNFQRCRWHPEPVQRMFKKGESEDAGGIPNQYRECLRKVNLKREGIP